MGKLSIAGKSPKVTAPTVIDGIILSDIAEGSIVKLNESSSPVEFYVACHNYEETLNGGGRTLLVRKNSYDPQMWDSNGENSYAISSIDAWLNGDYKAMFDSEALAAMGMTKFYYTVGGGDRTLTTLNRTVFLLSVEELFGNVEDDEVYNAEGSQLPIADVLRSVVTQWTRSPYLWNSYEAGYTINGTTTNTEDVLAKKAFLPAFTLPSTAIFDSDTQQFKGVL